MNLTLSSPDGITLVHPYLPALKELEAGIEDNDYARIRKALKIIECVTKFYKDEVDWRTHPPLKSAVTDIAMG